MRLAAPRHMSATVLDQPIPTVPSIFDHFPKVATQPQHAILPRKIAFWSSLVAVPAAAGIALGLASRRRGLVAGGVAALALAALRLQMARWFTSEPAHQHEGRVAGLELRRYPVRIEARAEVDAANLEQAIDRGFGLLACYIDGGNAEHQDLARTTPGVTTMRDGRFRTSFVMPPGRPISTLPRPDDPRIELREVPEKRVAVLRFRGAFTRDTVDAHERELLARLVEAGLSARGSVAFACYDSPMTLPLLRRNELWIDVV